MHILGKFTFACVWVANIAAYTKVAWTADGYPLMVSWLFTKLSKKKLQLQMLANMNEL